MYVLVYTVPNGWVGGLMMNALEWPKKSTMKKINYATVSKPPKNEWAERQGGKEKGRALQSKLFLKIFVQFSLHVRNPIAPNPSLGITQQNKRDIHQEKDNINIMACGTRRAPCIWCWKPYISLLWPEGRWKQRSAEGFKPIPLYPYKEHHPAGKPLGIIHQAIIACPSLVLVD